MKNYGLNELREKYLSFFESKEHLRLPSFSLIPKNDPSLLLINAGMAPLKNYFMGIETPPSKRITTCQKCIRTPDIDNVGKTARHGTFFEMLGNFSFGDYFKKEAINWAWEFLTEVLEIPKEKLYASVYLEDDEAYDIWTKEIGLPEEKVVRLDKDSNFWELGTGPCGPCSEIHFDRGEKYGCGKVDCTVGCDCDRYIEIWNLVFTQFDKQVDGTYEKLPNPNIDTGMGLERLACVMQGVDNLFEVDTVRRILDTVCKMAGKEYGKDYKTDVSIRVITDHIRSTVMMVSDGVIPSNEGRGYVLRRLLRGAARHGRMLGIEGIFLCNLADTVVDESKEAYPELETNRKYIKQIIQAEEDRFASTINQGLSMLEEIINEKNEQNDKSPLSGETAFKLHDTYGFPLSLTQDIMSEHGFDVDVDGFRKEMEAQKEKARAAIMNRESSWQMGDAKALSKYPKTEFVGYDVDECTSNILAIFAKSDEGMEEVEQADSGMSVIILTEKTPFYAESGGQEGDIGVISTETGLVKVLDTVKTDDRWRHIGVVEDGVVTKGQGSQLKVDVTNRRATERNHSCTHLLHKALKMVLGEHVHQAGSSVNAKRLRFDFNHMKALTKEELQMIEDIVNSHIDKGMEVKTDIMSMDEAMKSGAEALFDEKYGDSVRVVSMGDFSKELCGGTHVKYTASIGLAKIVHEGAVAAGIRRIEVYTGSGAREYLVNNLNILENISGTLKTAVHDTYAKVESLVEENKVLSREISELKKKIALGSSDDVLKNAKDINGITVATGRFDMLDANSLRELADNLRDKMDAGFVLLASGLDDKVSIVCAATKSAVQKGVDCGRIVKEAASMCKGGGGGRKDMAQAGGKDASAIDKMLASVEDIFRKQLN